MAVVRHVRNGIFVAICFLLSVIRFWPSRVTASAPAREMEWSGAPMLRLPSPGRRVGYGLQFSARPLRARLLRVSLAAAPARLQPRAFVGQLKTSKSTPNIIRTTTRTRTHPTCSSAPVPVPPPVTTVPGSSGPILSCTRMTTNAACHRFPPATTSFCALRLCCWTNNAPGGCVTISQFTMKHTTGTTRTHTRTTTFPTWTWTTTSGCFLVKGAVARC